MRRFAELYAALDRTTSTLAKRDEIVSYLSEVKAADAAWAVYVLGGGKLRRLAKSGELREALARASGCADWLIEESYSHVGDLAETIALMLPSGSGSLGDTQLREWMEQHLPALGKLEAEDRIERLQCWWLALETSQVFILNKLLTGALRVGVSSRLVTQALAQWSGQPTDLIAHRMSGKWQPTAHALESLGLPAAEDEHLDDRPYPFFLASPLEHDTDSLGTRAEWVAEWKWDGIRAQLMKRGDTVSLWSRGEERLDGRFPEIEHAAAKLAGDGVLDGEILAWDEDGARPRPFTALQTRIGKLKPSAKLIANTPVCFMAYDLLERAGEDLREKPLSERRRILLMTLANADPRLKLSAAVVGESWQALASLREESRERQTEGLMLKRLESPYRVGRKRGDWWKWKVDPYTLDAVLLYAQPGHGRRSGLFTDYTFGVWDGDALVPIAKAYSGLDDKEIGLLDRWIRGHTTERFGPVRSVEAAQVFELAFEAVQVSKRHKAGVAVRFPRIARWRTDKPIHEANSLDDLRRLATG